MKLMLGRLVALLVILGSLVLSLSIGCSFLSPGDTEAGTDNYTVSENTIVQVVNSETSGDVNITTWGKEYVEVSWTKRSTWGVSELGKAKVDVAQVPGNLKVETKVQPKNARVSLSYDIKLPKSVWLTNVTIGKGSITLDGTSGNTIVANTEGSIDVQYTSGYMDITAGKGNISLEGTTGGARLTTSDSSVVVRNTDGAITATTTNGNIEISDCKGDVTLETSRSGISISNLEGCVLRAKTTNGPIDISGATAVEVVETSHSDVTAEISSVGDNGTTIATSGGSVGLYLPKGMNAEIELSTSSGDIAFHLGGICISEELTSGYFKGTMGAGGNRIYVETSKGNIDLYRSEAIP
jgi:DUF4097 and DUF4098 domain-containing protein YvlB